MATALSSSIVENGSLNMSSFEKNEVRNAFLTLIFLSICHTFRTFFLNLARETVGQMDQRYQVNYLPASLIYVVNNYPINPRS